MKPFLLTLLILFKLLPIYAQELSFRDGWQLSLSHGASIAAPDAFPLRSITITDLHSSEHLQVAKQLTSTFAVALDYQYQNRRHIIAPMFRTDLLTFYRPDTYRISPHALLFDIGMGMGHYDCHSDSPTDHNYIVYLARLTYQQDIVSHLSWFLSAGANARTYSYQIGIVPSRMDLHIRFGLTYRFRERRCPHIRYKNTYICHVK